MLTYICILVSILYFNKGDATTIDVKPGNASAVLRTSAVFRCQISGQNSQVVFWKKIPPGATINNGYEVLSYDNVSITPSRYTVRNRYDIEILEVSMEDEGEYACDVGGGTFTLAYLSVIVPMENMTLTWGSTDDIVSAMVVNLTCTVINSRPPAEIRWYRGTQDITKKASKIVKSIRSTGFGDSISVLETVVSPGDHDVPFICSVDFPDHSGFRSLYLFPNVIGSASSQDKCSYLFISCLLSFLLFICRAIIYW